MAKKIANNGNSNLERCLLMVECLKNGRYTIAELAIYFHISERTVYRYIRLFDNIKLPIEQDFENRFFIIKQ